MGKEKIIWKINDKFIVIIKKELLGIELLEQDKYGIFLNRNDFKN